MSILLGQQENIKKEIKWNKCDFTSGLIIIIAVILIIITGVRGKTNVWLLYFGPYKIAGYLMIHLERGKSRNFKSISQIKRSDAYILYMSSTFN